MSQSFPPNVGGYQQHPGSHQQQPGGYQPAPGGYQQNPYAGHPAYGHPLPPGPQRSGVNAWLAAGLGALAGAFVTALLGGMFIVMMGFPMPWETVEDYADDWTGKVEVASNGSVSGPSLADAVLEVGGGGYYEEVQCLATSRVAQDVTTFCQVDDGFERYRVVVVFLGSDGRFETAELYSQ